MTFHEIFHGMPLGTTKRFTGLCGMPWYVMVCYVHAGKFHYEYETLPRWETPTTTETSPMPRGTFKSFNGKDPSLFERWHHKTSIVLSMYRPDIFKLMEGQTRPTVEATGEAIAEDDTFVALPPAPAASLTQLKAASDPADDGAVRYLIPGNGGTSILHGAQAQSVSGRKP